MNDTIDVEKSAIPDFVIRRLTQTPQQRKIARIGERDGWQCFYCGVTLASPAVTAACIAAFFSEEFGQSYCAIYPENIKSPTIDHKHPTSKGGTNDASNLVLACDDCNTLKSNRYTSTEFLAMRREASHV